jgi:hypothetical protein
MPINKRIDPKAGCKINGFEVIQYYKARGFNMAMFL